ncbi:hypothetical protein H6P81_006153 [Aristolochia fimbriata]|uniref:Uncharacterized protein n=1 Tax=Aristolochia fimbriata TaxID=158543 RepID=A0AAV7EXW8_ARIFI|nr:hypothetical protein H6P81_006153 [Aristolochia fimbriata]
MALWKTTPPPTLLLPATEQSEDSSRVRVTTDRGFVLLGRNHILPLLPHETVGSRNLPSSDPPSSSSMIARLRSSSAAVGFLEARPHEKNSRVEERRPLRQTGHTGRKN